MVGLTPQHASKQLMLGLQGKEIGRESTGCSAGRGHARVLTTVTP